jgi:hypothetical protein
MNPLEKALFQEETGTAEPLLCIRTKTRIDAGRWWRSVPVWLCVAGDELTMFAVARRRYFERSAIADCGASHYNHASGELVVEPAEQLRLSRFAMSPREALSILNFIKNYDKQTLTKTTKC